MRSRSLLCCAFLALSAVGSGCATSNVEVHPLGRDEAVAREAIEGYVKKGETALPELRELAKSDDPLVRRRAKTALGRITGQWGEDGKIVWQRSVAEAAGGDKPLMVLHLFGKFDEEFC